MKTRYLLKRYIVPAAILIFLIVWLNQQSANVDGRVLYTALVQQESVLYSGHRAVGSNPRLRPVTAYESHVVYQDHSASVERATSAPSTGRNTTLARTIRLHYSLKNKDPAKENSNADVFLQDKPFQNYRKQSYAENSFYAVLNTSSNSGINESFSPLKTVNQNYSRDASPAESAADDPDADVSLILARQMAAKNFVKSDVESLPSVIPLHVHNKLMSTLKSDGQSSDYASANSSMDLAKRKGSGEADADQLGWFADGAVLPDYDLPLLSRQTADNRTRTTQAPLSVVSAITNKTSHDDNELELDGVLTDTDDVMSGAVVLGKVKPNKNYAVFSTTTENRDALSFIFLLPLTALAWKRVGFDSVIVIVGPVDSWNSDQLLHFVLSCVRQLDSVVVFLEPRPEKSVMISQISRIFVANILRAQAAVENRNQPDVIDKTYLVTSDADIWPIYGDIYLLPDQHEILSLNSECCGAFSHRNVAYRMLPMANVGMRIETWRRLTRRFGESPRTVDDILTAAVREFGPVALRPVHKGDNVGWFLDQMMVSLLVADWTKRHGASSVKLVARDVGVDRIDRNAWGPGHSTDGISDKIDAHLLGSAYLPSVWAQLLPLVTQLYGYQTDRYVWCLDYYDNFQKLFISKYRSQTDHRLREH